MAEQNPFKWRHFQSDIILLCVRWYLRYARSYRDLEEMMVGRGLHVDHTTIYRWVQHYAPELERRCHPHVAIWTQQNRFFSKLSLLWAMFQNTSRQTVIAPLPVPYTKRWEMT